MSTRWLVILSVSLLAYGNASAQECDPLKPSPPRNLSEEVVGKIDAKVSGLASKLLNAGGTLEGTYRQASTDVLSEYPNADRLYLWDRTIYLYCVTINKSGLSDNEKMNRIEKLMDRLNSPPPEKQGLNLNEFRLGETSLDYVRSLLGTPRSDRAGTALFSKGGYEFTISYSSEVSDHSKAQGMVKSLRVARSPQSDGPSIQLIFDGGWNQIISTGNRVDWAGLKYGRPSPRSADPSPSPMIAKHAQLGLIPLKDFLRTDCQKIHPLAEENDDDDDDDPPVVIGNKTVICTMFDRVEVRLYVEWPSMLLHKAEIDDLFRIQSLYGLANNKLDDELKKLLSDLEQKNNVSHLDKNGVRERLNRRFAEFKVNEFELRLRQPGTVLMPPAPLTFRKEMYAN